MNYFPTKFFIIFCFCIYGNIAYSKSICKSALEELKLSTTIIAEENSFPIVCNWNYIFALEKKMIQLGDLKKRRTAKYYHSQINSLAIIKAQQRVGIKKTGIINREFFTLYMGL